MRKYLDKRGASIPTNAALVLGDPSHPSRSEGFGRGGPRLRGPGVGIYEGISPFAAATMSFA